jgi:putative chitinase
MHKSVIPKLREKFPDKSFFHETDMSEEKFIGEDIIANPDLVATKYPLSSAAFFFDSNKLWVICDEGINNSVVTSVTKKVNGGVIGLLDRIKQFNNFNALLG